MEYSEILLGAEQVSGLLTLFRVADIADLIHCMGLGHVYLWFWAGFVY